VVGCWKGVAKRGRGGVCARRVVYATTTVFVVAQTRSKKYPRGYTHCGVVYMLHTIHSYCST
jgi:hypothetical protein